MAEMSGTGSERMLTIRHRGRIAQIGIYFRKFLRMFVYQSDWKMLPMAAIIAGLVGFALGGDFRVSMEGTLTGAFAVVCVCIWNGSFNSIQVICRERDVIKREHRSGMHISSYILAHMMYQLLLCVLQTVITVLVLGLVGMKLSGKGLFTPWLSVDVGFTMFLVTYASDMLSLWISSLVHSTTTAMTIMPFVLIFQLIFSGGLLTLPSVVEPIMKLTISNPGLKAMCSQVQINDLPYETVTDMLDLVDDVELGGRVTLGQVLDALSDTDNKTVADLRAIKIGNIMTLRDVGEDLLKEDVYKELRDTKLFEGLSDDLTVGSLIEFLLSNEELSDVLSTNVGAITTLGDIVDFLQTDETAQQYKEEGITIQTTLGDILDLVGREETKTLVVNKASESFYNADYESTKGNIGKNWIHILIFVVVFAALAIITLEFIDKDKR